MRIIVLHILVKMEESAVILSMITTVNACHHILEKAVRFVSGYYYFHPLLLVHQLNLITVILYYYNSIRLESGGLVNAQPHVTANGRTSLPMISLFHWQTCGDIGSRLRAWFCLHIATGSSKPSLSPPLV